MAKKSNKTRVPTNIYRCLTYCPNCPFKDNGKKINLHKNRVAEIKKLLLASDHNSFNCHKTVYDLDNTMQPTEEQKLKMCYGAYKFLKEQGVYNMAMRLALIYGIDKELSMENINKLFEDGYKIMQEGVNQFSLVKNEVIEIQKKKVFQNSFQTIVEFETEEENESRNYVYEKLLEEIQYHLEMIKTDNEEYFSDCSEDEKEHIVNYYNNELLKIQSYLI